MVVQFANGKLFHVEHLDEAIAQCLAGGDDPFNPKIIYEETIEDNGNTNQQ